MRWWPFRRRNGRADAHRREVEANAKLRAAKRATEHVQRMAPHVADLSAEEFAERVSRAFRGWA